MRTIRIRGTVIAIVLVVGLLPVAAQTNWKVERTIHIGGDGGWDYHESCAPPPVC